jgi:hypothetical protein
MTALQARLAQQNKHTAAKTRRKLGLLDFLGL